MTKVELLEKTAKTLFESDSKMISTNEYNTLIANAATQAEKDFYSEVYNYLLGKKQQEIVANEKYKKFIIIGCIIAIFVV